MPMDPMPWSTSDAALMFAMWWVMMIAMMVPSAAPMVLLFTAIKRKQAASVSPSVEAWVFLGGYLLIWAGFSLVAALAQWGLERAGLLSMAMASTSAMFGGVILLAAGLYQFTPVKSACLRYCQSPVLFLSRHWRPGAAGALRMGLRHGGYCLGCCWFLMALLFVSRCHEPCLDCRHRPLCRMREVAAARPAAQPRRWRGPDRIGHDRSCARNLRTRLLRECMGRLRCR